MTVTIDHQQGNVCAITDTIENVVKGISENCSSPRSDVLGFVIDSSDNVTVFFVKTK